MPDGQQMQFDHQGGFFLQLEKPGIVGRTLEGEWVFIKLDDVFELHGTSPQIIKLWKKRELRNQKIIEVINKDGTLVRFDSNGGVYDDSKLTVRGNERDGEERVFGWKSTVGARLFSPESISKDSLLENWDQSISEVLTNDQELFIFERYGGMFVEPSNIVVGFTPKGSRVKLDRDQINFLKVERPDRRIPFFFGLMNGWLFLGLYALYLGN
jgi:hypothetical protein